MKDRNVLSRIIDVREGEGLLVLSLFGTSIFLALPVLFTNTAALSIFLARFSSANLPYVYIAIAIVVPLASTLYLQLERRLTRTSLFIAVLAAAVCGDLVLRVALSELPGPWITAALPVWGELLVVLLSLAFWGAAGYFFDVRQSKRLLGIVNGGRTAALIAGGLSVPWLVARIGPQNLMLLSAGSSAVSLVMLFLAIRRFPAAAGRNDAAGGASAGSQSRRSNREYIGLVLLLFALYDLGYYFVDNAFYDRVVDRFGDAQGMAAFLGPYVSINAFLLLSCNVFMVAPWLRRFGVGGGLLLLPAAVLGGSALVVGTSLVVGMPAVFWPTVLTRTLEYVSRSAFYLTSLAILYQPLPESERMRAQGLAEGFAGPFSAGLAGLALLGLSRQGVSALQICSMLLLICAAWIPVTLLVRRLYVKKLTQALSRFSLSGKTIDLADAATMRVVGNALRSPYPGEALHALNLIDENRGPLQLQTTMAPLLIHPAAEVREEALNSIERHHLVEAAPEVRQCAQSDPSLRVRGRALQVCATIDENSAEFLAAFQDDPRREVRCAALTGLLKLTNNRTTPWLDQVVQLGHSEESADRTLAAEILGGTRSASFSGLLMQLLNDSEIPVRREALRAAGRIGNPEFLPVILDSLSTASLRQVAASALVAMGAGNVKQLEQHLSKDSCGPKAQTRLIAVLGRIGTPEATASLLSLIGASDPRLRHAATQALARSGYRAGTGQVQDLHRVIVAEAAAAAGLLVCQKSFQGEEHTLLAEALQTGADQCIERIFVLLSLVYPQKIIRAVQDKWRLPGKKAIALELLDTLVPRDLSTILLPLLDNADPESLSRLFPQTAADPSVRLEKLCGNSDRSASSWIRVAALHTAQKETMLSTIEKVLILKSVSIFSSTPNETVAEIAQVLEDVQVEAGQAVFRKGEPGHSMFILVSGRVRIHDGDHTFRELGDREVFGEMAVLDSEPRSATVTALEDTRLFELDRSSFFEVMSDHTEIAQGVFQVLCKRLRELSERVALMAKKD